MISSLFKKSRRSLLQQDGPKYYHFHLAKGERCKQKGCWCYGKEIGKGYNYAHSIGAECDKHSCWCHGQWPGMGPPTIDPRDQDLLYNSGITAPLFYLDDGKPVFDNRQKAPYISHQDDLQPPSYHSSSHNVPGRQQTVKKASSHPQGSTTTSETQSPNPQHPRSPCGPDILRPRSSPSSYAPSQSSRARLITPQYHSQYPPQGHDPIAATQQPRQSGPRPPAPQAQPTAQQPRPPWPRPSSPQSQPGAGSSHQQPCATSAMETSPLDERPDLRTASSRSRTGSPRSSTAQQYAASYNRSRPKVQDSDRQHVPVFIDTPSVAPTISVLDDTESLAPSEACGEPRTYWNPASTARSANSTRAASSTAAYRPPPSGYDRWDDAYNDVYYPEDISEVSSRPDPSESQGTFSGSASGTSSGYWTYGSGSNDSTVRSSKRQRTETSYTPQLAPLTEGQVEASLGRSGGGGRSSSSSRRCGSEPDANGFRRGSRVPSQSASAHHRPRHRDRGQWYEQKLPSIAEGSRPSSDSYFGSEYETDNGTEEGRGASTSRPAPSQSSRRTYVRKPPSAADSDEAARRLLEELGL